MKKCPQCSRTYADDGFTFCLEDGALLSAPYEPEEGKPAKTLKSLKSNDPPPTAVMPRRTDPQLAPTIPSPPPVRRPETKPAVPSLFEESIAPRKSSPVRYVVIALIAVSVLVIAVLLFATGAGTTCPELVISCTPGDARTYCELEEKDPKTSRNLNGPISEALSSLRPVLGLQAAAQPLPKSVTGAIWSVSAGTVESQGTQMSVLHNGMAGKRITVEATIQSTSWFCSKTISTSFVVPASTFPAK